MWLSASTGRVSAFESIYCLKGKCRIWSSPKQQCEPLRRRSRFWCFVCLASGLETMREHNATKDQKSSELGALSKIRGEEENQIALFGSLKGKMRGSRKEARLGGNHYGSRQPGRGQLISLSVSSIFHSNIPVYLFFFTAKSLFAIIHKLVRCRQKVFLGHE